MQEGVTQQMDFPAGATLNIANSRGELSIEGWDRPQVELTLVKSLFVPDSPADRQNASLLFEKNRVAMAPSGGGVRITTTLQNGRRTPPRTAGSPAEVSLDYRIRVPRDAKIVVEHGKGEVHVAGVASDISVRVGEGEITLLLAPDGPYAIDARTRLGDLVSDFAGQPRRRLWIFAHEFAGGPAAAAPKLRLRVGFGDILILKASRPQMPVR
jgi:hypothetical protein